MEQYYVVVTPNGTRRGRHRTLDGAIRAAVKRGGPGTWSKGYRVERVTHERAWPLHLPGE